MRRRRFSCLSCSTAGLRCGLCDWCRWCYRRSTIVDTIAVQIWSLRGLRTCSYRFWLRVDQRSTAAGTACGRRDVPIAPVVFEGAPEPFPSRTIATLSSAIQICSVGLASVTITVSPPGSVSARRWAGAMFNVIDAAIRTATVYSSTLFTHATAADQLGARTPCTELPRVAEDLLDHPHHTFGVPVACPIRSPHHNPGLLGTVALHMKVKIRGLSRLHGSGAWSPWVCCKEWHKHDSKSFITVDGQHRRQIQPTSPTPGLNANLRCTSMFLPRYAVVLQLHASVGIESRFHGDHRRHVISMNKVLILDDGRIAIATGSGFVLSKAVTCHQSASMASTAAKIIPIGCQKAVGKCF